MSYPTSFGSSGLGNALPNGFSEIFSRLSQSSSHMLDDVAAIAAYLCGCPMGSVSISDEDNQYYGGTFGLDHGTQQSVHAFFLRWITEREPVQIRDLNKDPVHSKDPLVTQAPWITSFLAIPILSKGGGAFGVLGLLNGSTSQYMSQRVMQGVRPLADLVPELIKGRKKENKEAEKPAREGLDEVEREELGRELHDGVGQWLTAANLYSQVISSKLEDREDLSEELSALTEVVSKAQDEVRFLSHSMVGVELRSHGLGAALDSLIQRYHGLSKAPAIEAELDVLDEARFDHESKLNLYRVVQEFLNNSLKYSDAQKVLIKFKASSCGTSIYLTDDGKGFEPDEQTVGVGLRSMKERIEKLGGKYEMEAAPGEGVRLSIELPYTDRSEL